jgi:uncharacterized protein (DUF2252 family)
MVTRDVAERLTEFNADRDPVGVKLKYSEMAQNPINFLRGTCHLFYQDLPQTTTVFQEAPLVWLCGDFGTYQGADRQVYFDINDFDEGLLAPCTWDLVRFLTGLWVVAPQLKLDRTAARQLGEGFLAAYGEALAIGKARAVQRETATGIVLKRLEDLEQRDRADFLDQRTDAKGKHRTLKLIKQKTVALAAADRAWVTDLLDRWAATQPQPEFYQVRDVVQRIAGNGSLGLARYLILVAGKGSPDKNYLLDLKGARPSSLAPYVPTPQPNWPTEADRIVAIQQRFQAFPPRVLSGLWGEHRPEENDRAGRSSPEPSYILRELQPTMDKIDLVASLGKEKQLMTLMQTMGRVTAWGQIRSSGRDGSAITGALIDFADRASTWQPDLLDYAEGYAVQVDADYRAFQHWLAQS